MSEFKFTKGEWGVYGDRYCRSIENENAESICAINTQSFSDEEFLANAKLIACAPEMLKMLEKISSTLKKGNSVNIESIDELIKKATV